jgi:hypothetical protein
MSLAVFGIYHIFKNRKWILISELILGVVFWFFYSFTTFRFFIEFERIAIFTSIITVIVSGFGLQEMEEYIKSKLKKNAEIIIKTSEILMLLIFLFLIPFYTQGENWEKIIAVNYVTGDVAYPKSPANNYLTADDLKIFKDIKGKTFLSLPWKGTVIGIATGNYPILVKDGTIGIGSVDTLNNFLGADCAIKKRMAKSLKLDYIYVSEFDCPGFEEVAESSENLFLYKVK